MSRLFVGQRVKLVAKRSCANTPRKIGAQGVIDRVGPFVVGTESRPGYVFSSPDDYFIYWGDGGYSSVLSFQIEPILPDGHRPCDEEFKLDLDKMLEGLPA